MYNYRYNLFLKRCDLYENRVHARHSDILRIVTSQDVSRKAISAIYALAISKYKLRMKTISALKCRDFVRFSSCVGTIFIIFRRVEERIRLTFTKKFFSLFSIHGLPWTRLKREISRSTFDSI